MNRDWAASASSSLLAPAPNGGGMLLSGCLVLFYIIFAIVMSCSLKFFAKRYLLDTRRLSPRCLIAPGQPQGCKNEGV